MVAGQRLFTQQLLPATEASALASPYPPLLAPKIVRALFSVHPPGAANEGSPPDETFLFTPATLALFFCAAFIFLCLAYGIAAPTGLFRCM